MKATKQYFPCGTVYYAVNVVLTLMSVDEILQYDHSIENSAAVLSNVIVFFFSNFTNLFSNFLSSERVNKVLIFILFI